MARARIVKPAFFRHLGLYQCEREVGLPVRIAFEGLWTSADREGRFKWEAPTLKLDALPFDEVDFGAVLDALAKHGFIKRYEVEGQAYGYIPSWQKHQHIHVKEPKSTIPAPVENGAGTVPAPVLSGAKSPLSDSDSDSDSKNSIATQLSGTPLDLKKELFTRGVLFLKTNGVEEPRARALLGRWRQDHGDVPVLMALASAEGGAISEVVSYVTAVLQGRMKPHGRQQRSDHPKGFFGELAEKLRDADQARRPEADR